MSEIDRWNDTHLEFDPQILHNSIVSIDPGDIHVGVATWVYGAIDQDENDQDVDGWICEYAFETQPVPFLRALQVACGSGMIDTVVFERFVLEPTRAPMLVGTDLETAQMIGAIKFAVNGRAELVGQTNKIKIPTRSLLRSSGVKSVAKRLKAGGHAFDAELHGAHYIIKTLGQEIVNG